MKYFLAVILCCEFLSGCGKGKNDTSQNSSIENEQHSGCSHVCQALSKESHAEKDSYSDWSEKNLREIVRSANGGNVRSARELAAFYQAKGDIEKARYWLNVTREKLEALPAEDTIKRAIPKIDAMVAELDERISFYKMSEEEVLGKYAQWAESGELRSAEKLYAWYEKHHQVDQAKYWLGKVRDLMIQRAGYTEEAQQHFQKWFDTLENKLSEKAASLSEE